MCLLLQIFSNILEEKEATNAEVEAIDPEGAIDIKTKILEEQREPVVETHLVKLDFPTSEDDLSTDVNNPGSLSCTNLALKNLYLTLMILKMSLLLIRIV